MERRKKVTEEWEHELETRRKAAEEKLKQEWERKNMIDKMREEADNELKTKERNCITRRNRDG